MLGKVAWRCIENWFHTSPAWKKVSRRSRVLAATQDSRSCPSILLSSAIFHHLLLFHDTISVPEKARGNTSKMQTSIFARSGLMPVAEYIKKKKKKEKH